MEAYVIGDHAPSIASMARHLERAGVRCPERFRTSCAEAFQGRLSVARAGIAFYLAEAPHEDVIAGIRRLRENSFRSIVAVGVANESQSILECIRAGACDVLPVRESFPADLSAVVGRLQAELAAEGTLSRAVAVLSCGGGAGGTTLAANLAVASPGECCLLDFNFDRPDLASLFHLAPRYSIRDLTGLPDLDSVAFERSLLTHAESGVRLLAGDGAGMLRNDDIDAAALMRLIGLARKLCPHVVVELDDVRRSREVAAAAECDAVAVVFRLDFVSLTRAKTRIDRLAEGGVSLDRILPVAGRSGQPMEISADKASEALGRPIYAHIPDDPGPSLHSVNVGRPVALASPHSRVSRSIAEMASRLFDVEQTAASLKPEKFAMFRFSRLFVKPA